MPHTVTTLSRVLILTSKDRLGPKTSPGLWLGPAHNNRCMETQQQRLARVSQYFNHGSWYFTSQNIPVALMLTRCCVKSMVFRCNLNTHKEMKVSSYYSPYGWTSTQCWGNVGEFLQPVTTLSMRKSLSRGMRMTLSLVISMNASRRSCDCVLLIRLLMCLRTEKILSEAE